jgi:hypothetical protein
MEIPKPHDHVFMKRHGEILKAPVTRGLLWFVQDPPHFSESVAKGIDYYYNKFYPHRIPDFIAMSAPEFKQVKIESFCHNGARIPVLWQGSLRPLHIWFGLFEQAETKRR